MKQNKNKPVVLSILCQALVCVYNKSSVIKIVKLQAESRSYILYQVLVYMDLKWAIKDK